MCGAQANKSEFLYDELVDALLANTSDIVFVLNDQGKVVQHSMAAASYIDTDPPTLSGQILKDLLQARGLIYPISEQNLIKKSTLWRDKIINWRLSTIASYQLLIGSVESQKAQSSAVAAMHALFEQSECNMYWVDKQGVTQGANPQVLKMLQLTPDAYAGRTYRDFAKQNNMPEWMCQKFEEDEQYVMQTGNSITGSEEPAIILPDGTQRYFISYRVPIRSQIGETVGAAGISFDVTNLKLNKAYYEVEDRAKMVYLHNMVHDVCTPLNSIGNYFEKELTKAHPKENKHNLNSVLVCIKQITQQMKQALKYLKTGGLSKSNEQTIFNIGSVLQAIEIIIAPCAKAKHLEFSMQGDDLPIFSIGDGDKLKRILLNLLVNAVSYTKKGGVVFTTALHDIEGTSYLKFNIVDSGCGIPDDQINNIFDRYYQANTSEPNIGCGIGLGLSIVKQFTEELDGELNVKSELEKGSNFEVLIPYVEPE